MPDDAPVRWGIVSTADINRKVIPGAKASPKVDLVGVASRTQERADEYAAKWGIPHAYGSYEALLAERLLDGPTRMPWGLHPNVLAAVELHGHASLL